ncbi:glycosyltransferase family 4 protein [Phormidium tenue FACHB-886]|nr:glycosyltransferase family 4 protein [Phormidium tenue FACHB-886]
MTEAVLTRKTVSAKSPRLAWLFPSLEQGNYWHPVLKELTQVYPQSIVYTGTWTGYAPGYEGSFQVEVVGKMRFVDTAEKRAAYGRGMIVVSPGIVKVLLKDKPDVIFTSGFSLWTLLVLLTKFIGGWRVVVMYDGSSPTVDYLDAPVRLFVRRLMTLMIDAFVTNSAAGEQYLTKTLGSKNVFAKPYQVPDAKALLNQSTAAIADLPQQKPIFLFVGQLIPRKGIQPLLEACKRLKDEGCDFTLLVIGKGEQRSELEQYCRDHALTNVRWVGSISYGELGTYFRQSDVFILPTLEDVWGMVVLEAMALGKPVLCSQWAGAAELVKAGENGYLFDPHQPESIVEAMRHFIAQPEQIAPMGQRSAELIAPHTPEASAQFLVDVVRSLV